MSSTKSRRRTPLSSLPDVVIRQVVTHLDNVTLKSLRLTSQILCYHATIPLYSTLVLTPHVPHFDFVLSTQLKRDTRCNGLLAKYVRTLVFDPRCPSANLSSSFCVWHKSYLHYFMYDARVLSQNVVAAKGERHFEYLVGRMTDVLQALPNLTAIIVKTHEPGAIHKPHEVPAFFFHHFRDAFGQQVVAGRDIVLETTEDDQKMYVDAINLAIGARESDTVKIMLNIFTKQ